MRKRDSVQRYEVGNGWVSLTRFRIGECVAFLWRHALPDAMPTGGHPTIPAGFTFGRVLE